MSRKIKRKRVSKEEKQKHREEKKFRTDINTIFLNAAFTQIPTRNEELVLNGRKFDVDNLFIYENIIVLCEDTTLSDGNKIRDHLRKTAENFDNINNNKEEFIELMSKKFKKFKRAKKKQYNADDLIITYIYCSLHKFDKKYRERYNKMMYLDYKNLQYFLRLSKTIHKSIRFEVFKFLGLSLGKIGTFSSGTSRKYEGFLLPESPTGYPKGFKIVTFLIEPIKLIEQTYVLRRDGWKDSDCLYQRLLIPTKIKKMREYLVSEGRVFVNNIIVTLPDSTVIFDTNGKQIEKAQMKEKKRVNIQIDSELNTIGVIDGQHRIFAYHEGGDKLDKAIAILRNKQHLLLTGIIYPDNISEHDRTKFEAQLFLEINDKQSRVKANLKQVIETLVNPYSSIAISKKILTQLADTGPLSGYLEEHFYDTKKIKTSSIVSYGLIHLVKLDEDGTLFKIWKKKGKKKLMTRNSKALLDEYAEYCTSKINDFLVAFKKNIADDMWTLDKKKSRVLTTTTINGLVYCIRKLVQENKIMNMEQYESGLKKLKINFSPSEFKYKSSHWKALGDKIYEDCFK